MSTMPAQRSINLSDAAGLPQFLMSLLLFVFWLQGPHPNYRAGEHVGALYHNSRQILVDPASLRLFSLAKVTSDNTPISLLAAVPTVGNIMAVNAGSTLVPADMLCYSEPTGKPRLKTAIEAPTIVMMGTITTRHRA
jgi:hypothetical protein